MADHFFIVGAQRTGTTYLYTLLDEHPEIEMAKPVWPEPKYFLNDDIDAAAYAEKFFTEDTKCRGEKSTTYIEREDAARRISKTFPDARIIMVLRDPIERAISNYAFSVKSGHEALGMWDAFSREADQIEDYDHGSVSASPFAYLARGRYIDAVRMYEKFFSRDHIYLLLHEVLVNDGNVVSDVYKFLGVDTMFEAPSLGRAINPSDGHDRLTGDQYEQLAAYFAPHTRALADHAGVDVSLWPSYR